MENAPLYNDVARGPDNGTAYWLKTSDGVRIRIGVWPTGGNGTVLMFPGRTEYIEKYGKTAAELAKRGYAMLAIDWRGQGLADRMLDDRDTGHVMHFADYQHDVAAAIRAANDLDLPRPYYLLSHSMGGLIALRALMEKTPVNAAFFSAPMLGILMAAPMRPIAWGVSWASRMMGMGHKYAPGTNADSYVNTAEFLNNTLTTDPEMYAYMQDQAKTHPQLALGGPSMHWLFEALTEGRDLSAKPAPDTPAICFLGTNERIVDPAEIKKRMGGWPDGELVLVDRAEHEILMETPATRQRAFDAMTGLFAAHR
jgi:lysophospholipase